MMKYVNEPAWSEPLEMHAEFIGRHGSEEALPNAAAMGQALVEMALPLDAIFASKLGLCGPEVWGAVREPVGGRLRRLHRRRAIRSGSLASARTGSRP